MNENPENIRVLLDLALSAGKSRKSPQTGYLHHFYHLQNGQPHLTIPLVENFLFALALLRSRTVENIQEAKTILEGLLFFQNKIEGDPAKGNFPAYMHEFPSCKNYLTGIQVACAIYWILKQFHQVLGQDLKKRLFESMQLAVGHALTIWAEKKLSYPMKVKIAAATFSCGRLADNAPMIAEGEQMLKSLQSSPDTISMHCPVSLGSIAVSLLMAFPKLNESPWKFLWDHLQKTWHRKTASFAGLSLKERQSGSEPEVTIYDLLCGYFSGGFSDRALKDSIVHLQAVLIPQSDERFQSVHESTESQIFQDENGFSFSDKNMAYCCIEKKEPEANLSVEKEKCYFKLLWGNKHRTHTFVCQGGNTKCIFFNLETAVQDKVMQDFELKSLSMEADHSQMVKAASIGSDYGSKDCVNLLSSTAVSRFNEGEIIFDLEGEAEIEDKEKNREILFFIDAHEGLEFFVSGKKSSTFALGEKLTIQDQHLKLSLSFHLDEGDGRFMGHWMPGNRPSQQEAKGEARFEANDWQLFLRTIQRSDKCRLKVMYTIEHF